MEILIPYGQSHEPITVNSERIAGIITPNKVECGDQTATLKHALNNPFDSPLFSEFMSGPGQTLVIVNDGTRPTPTAKALEILQPLLDDKNCEYMIATGCHRAPTEEEFRYIFGKYYDQLNSAGQILVHDSKDKNQLDFIGSSQNGTEMWVNKKITNADRILVIGSVEPHYFAGYTGGRKAILPGCAGYETITMNHKFALKQEAKALALQGNPVHEDMIDALNTLKDKKIFSVQMVLDQNKSIYACYAGHIVSSMDAAVKAANQVFAVKIPQKEDIVVSIAPYPMDVDLYQSQKAIDNGKLALNPEGILIMVSKCRTGIGPETFFKLLSSCETPAQVMKKIDREFKLGYHKAAKMAEIGLWAETWAVSELDPESMKKIFIRPFNNIQTAVDAALKKKGPDARILFLLEGSMTVPMIGN